MKSEGLKSEVVHGGEDPERKHGLFGLRRTPRCFNDRTNSSKTGSLYTAIQENAKPIHPSGVP
jgi:hypothetical protein